jgi:hypothetical protein
MLNPCRERAFPNRNYIPIYFETMLNISSLTPRMSLAD